MTAAEPEKYPWREPRDMNCDTLGVVVAALQLDFDAAVHILSSLSDEQMTSLCWALARWFADSLAEDFEDPVGMLRGLALVLAHGRGESA